MRVCVCAASADPAWPNLRIVAVMCCLVDVLIEWVQALAACLHANDSSLLAGSVPFCHRL